MFNRAFSLRSASSLTGFLQRSSIKLFSSFFFLGLSVDQIDMHILAPEIKLF